MTSFVELKLRPELQQALDELGYEEPTPIQREAIPVVLSGRDAVAQAATGTGKTAAFALPLLQGLEPGSRTPQALVLAPTRELAVQVAEATQRYGRQLGARVLAVYGGQPIPHQMRALSAGVDVVVATPGRAIDHLTRGTLDLSDLRTLVLDEADEMLDMGFAEDIEAIMAAVPDGRQTVLFSATLPARINGLVKRYLTDPVKIKIERPKPSAEGGASVRQVAYLVPRQHKANALGRVLDIEAPTAAVVFCRTRDEVDSLGGTLAARGYRAEALHGGMTQDQRDRVMAKIRNRTAEILVATDVAARGLDIDHLTHVVNFDLPSAADTYVHRIGRVGRAGREGTAITLVEPRQHRLLKTIEKVTKSRIAVETLPTVADLRARRLELTRGAIAELLREDDYEQYRVVVDALSDEHDIVQIALAAVKLAHESGIAGPDEDDIPEVTVAAATAAQGTKRPPKNLGDTVTIFVGLGHAAKIRPQDLVGAIANETSVAGRQIGAIEITHKFSTVEIPAAAEAEVVAALQATLIKGRKARVERFKPPSQRPPSKKKGKQP
ncbi:ATP-dependent RNA helicase DeaD [Jatrophihabitans endophyticus]|uniref:RNA helicase n=1 Tax=Jatrophihabitans endophyticus TaxID=1206085 RepID=A0A1M5I0J0_9ACTN|nr:DEAD/DEAH box helicase [Jatrophihabitans endophyticus]SHG21824.1 ATP-dependent RNA helicase DeaD [Jatrophihabitans endophyticus]